MSTTRYAIKIADEDFTKNIDLTSVTFNRRYTLERVLKSTDGSIAVDLSVVGTQSLLYLETSASITIGLSGGATFVVDSALFMTKGMAIISIENLDPLVDATVKLYAYGSVA
jgi:hypothetical protein